MGYQPSGGQEHLDWRLFESLEGCTAPLHMSSVGHRIGGNQPKQGDYGFLRPAAKPAMQIFKEPKELTMKDMEFLNRMDNDTEDRRRTAFITQLSA